MKITIDFIHPDAMRYKSEGDWLWIPNGTLAIFVSDQLSLHERYGVALHELAEAFLCLYRGITTFQVDQWDMQWKGDGEPGDDQHAPYFSEHKVASAIEHLFLMAIGEPPCTK